MKIKMMRCLPCNGSGRVMGGGMMMADCENCDGRGKIQEVDDELDYLAMKQTQSYLNAKERLMSKNVNLTHEEAEELLDDAFEKEKPKTKPGRKKKEA